VLFNLLHGVPWDETLRDAGGRVIMQAGRPGFLDQPDESARGAGSRKPFWWPYSGHTTPRKTGRRCKTMSKIPAGQAAYAQLAARRDTIYGSAGHGPAPLRLGNSTTRGIIVRLPRCEQGSWDHARVAHRRMRDPKFRQEQVDGLRMPHVAPVNALVDELIDPASRGWVPYVAPVYGGVHARVLCILRDPGPMTHSEHGGSGFLCPENDDATAERFATLLDEAGIAVNDILGWNAYPWYINRAPRAAELEAGMEPLRRLCGLLPELRVVMLHGGSARDGWARLAQRHPAVAARFEVVPTYHMSSQAFIGPPEVRAARMTALRQAFALAASVLHKANPHHSPQASRPGD
jgi:hypothetical protein